LDLGKTKVAEIIRKGEVDSYLDGKARKITGPSIYRRICRKLREAKQQAAARPASAS
jgi:hypothetical protein